MSIFDFFRRKKKAEPVNETQEFEPTRHCFVLSGSPEPDDLSQADEVVGRIFGPGYTAEVSEGKVISIAHGEETIGFLAHMPMAIPEGEAADCAEGNFLWPDGKEEAAQHSSHVIVTNLGAADQTPVQSALAVSRLALVALEVFDGIGVYWGNASVSHAREVFENFCADISEEDMPVPVWLRFQFVQAKGDEVGIYTLGMSQFGLMDIEVDGCRMAPQDLFEFVSNIAHYLIQSGPVIEDGNTVGTSEDERILVRHQPSMIDDDRNVYKIVFES